MGQLSRQLDDDRSDGSLDASPHERDLKADGAEMTATDTGTAIAPIQLHEPMMLGLLASCAAAMVRRAQEAEETIVGLAHQLSARGHDVPDQAADDRPREPPITAVQAAKMLGLDRNTLYDMLKRGEGPPARRCGTSYRLDPDAVREWLRSGDGARTRRAR